MYGNLRSPYRPLLAAAGAEFGDVAALISGHGIEGVLSRLQAAGVGLSLDEFKGRVPVVRGALELHPLASDFDNPLLLRHYSGSTSGSRGTGSRVAVDLDLLDLEASYLGVVLRSFGAVDRPAIAWRAVPPGLAGLKGMLKRAKLGLDTGTWFSPTRVPAGRDGLPFRGLLAGTLAIARICGRPIPRPRVLELGDPGPLARGLAALAEAGTPALLDTTWSSAARLAEAARAEDLTITGTLFRTGGESATPGRVAALEERGCLHHTAYSMGEIGRIGEPCARRIGADDVHLLDDKVAVLQPGLAAGDPGLVLSSVSTSAPKVMLNVETGDRGGIREAQCGCPLGELGLQRILSGVHSREKLTAQGMNFGGSQIAWLLEEALPAQLGGSGSDYQLVSGLNGERAMGVVVGRAAIADDARIAEILLESVASLGPAQAMMAEQWRQAGGVAVLRREPLATRNGKVQQLHVVPGGQEPATQP